MKLSARVSPCGRNCALFFRSKTTKKGRHMPSWSNLNQPFPKAIRRRILKRDPICKHCGVAESREADHITNQATCRRQGINPHTLDNGQGLCPPCHRKKTLREINEGRQRTSPHRVYRHPSDT